jgi:7-cyano-7-deazaguanine synthase in queuosine biosynthesis
MLTDILANNQRIGVFVSGGFDSALLLYMLYLYKSQHEIHVFVIDRPNDSLASAKKVINWIEERFGVTCLVHTVGNSNSHHSLHVITGLMDAKKFGLDVLLLGDTANPAELVGGPNRPISNSTVVQQPFITYTKDKLVRISSLLNVLELLDISHSCELPVVCGQCWHCREKEWAIKNAW